MNTRILSTVCAAGILGITPAAFTANAQRVFQGERIDVKTSVGEIAIVNEEDTRFSIKMADEKELAFTFNDETVYTLNGKESTREVVLKAGMPVVVKHEGGIALQIDATTPAGG